MAKNIFGDTIEEEQPQTNVFGDTIESPVGVIDQPEPIQAERTAFQEFLDTEKIKSQDIVKLAAESQIPLSAAEESLKQQQIQETISSSGLAGGDPSDFVEGFGLFKEAKNEIGFFEALKRKDKFELLPFVGPVYKAAKLDILLQDAKVLQTGNITAIDPTIPGFPFVPFTTESRPATEEEKAKSTERLQAFLIKLEEEQSRGFSIGGKFALGLAELPSFIVEFIATGPLFKTGSAAGKAAATKLLTRFADSTGKRLFIRGTGAFVGTALRTAVNVPRVLQGALERMTEGVQLTEQGAIIFANADKPFSAFAASFADLFIENISEIAGEKAIPEFVSFVGGNIAKRFPLIGKFSDALAKKWVSNKAGRTLADFAKVSATKIGYDGILEEMGEEQLGRILRVATGLQSFNEIIPSAEDLLVEVGVISTLGGAVKVITPKVTPQAPATPVTEQIEAAAPSKEAEPTITPPREQAVTEDVEGVAEELGKIKPEDVKKGTKIEIVSEKTGKIIQGEIVQRAGEGKVEIKLETGIQREATVDELFEPASPEAVDKSKAVLAAKEPTVDKIEEKPRKVKVLPKKEVEIKPKEVEKIAASIGASRSPQLDKALQSAARKEGTTFVKQINGKWLTSKQKPKHGDFFEVTDGKPKAVKGQVSFKVEGEAITSARSIAKNTKESVFVAPTDKGFLITKEAPEVEHVEIKPAGPGLTREERAILSRQQIAEFEIGQEEGGKVGFKAGREEALIEGRAKIKAFQLAEKLTEKNRIDALDVVKRFVPKNKQERFTKRILEAKTSKRVDRITQAVELFIEKAEKRQAVRDLKKFIAKTNKEFKGGEVKLGRLPSDIRSQVLQTFEEFDLAKLSKAKREQLESRDRFIKRISGTVADAFESLEEEGIDILKIPNARIDELTRLSKTHIGELSTEQINYVRSSLEHLIDIARKRGESRERVRAERVGKQVNKAKQEVSRKVKEVGVIEQPTGLRNLAKQTFIQGNSTIRTMAGRATTKDNKATMDLLVEGIQESKRAEHADLKDFSQASTKEIVDKLGFTEKDSRKLDKLTKITLGGKTFDIDIDNLFSIYMAIRAEGNLRQLLKAKGLHITVIKRNPLLLNAVKKKTLIVTGTPQLSELRKVVEIIEAIPKLKRLSEITFEINKDVISPRINETSVAFQNFEIARKDKYWPQPRVTVKMVEGKSTDISIAAERQGMFLPKRGGTAPLLINPYRSQFVDIVQSSADFAANTLSIRDAKALLGNKDWQKKMITSGRGAELKGLVTMFRRIQGASGDKGFVDLAGEKLLNNFGRAVLSLRLSGYGVQVASVPAAYEFIDPKYFVSIKGVTKAVRVSNKEVQEMEDLSPTLWVRWHAGQYNFVTGGLAAQHAFDTIILDKTPLLDRTMSHYKWGDQKAIKMIFDAAQNKVSAEQGLRKGSKANKEAAIKETERALETQPNWDMIYRTPLTSSPNFFLRGSLRFLSARNAQWNVVARAVQDFRKGRISAKEAGKRAGGVLYANILVATVKRLIKLGVKGVFFGLFLFLADSDDEREKIKEAAKAEAKKDVKRIGPDATINLLGLSAFGDIPSTIVNDIMRKGTPNTWRKLNQIRTGNFFTDLGLDAAATSLDTAALVENLLTGEKIERGPRKGRPKWKDNAKDAATGVAELISLRYGLPLAAPKQEILFQKKAAERAVKKKGKKSGFEN